jgi:putative salt-induced outer membrane protein
VCAVALVFALVSTCGAQTPAPPPPAAPAEPPPPPWAGSIGAGLALTAGHTDTVNINVSFALTSNPKARNVIKSEGLYLRGETDSELAVDRTALKGRDEFGLSPKTFVFGQVEYLRDTFKSIDYLVSPTAGAGYKVVDDAKTTFTVDGGLGLIWEKNPLRDVRTSGAVTAGENLSFKFSDTAAFTHSVGALWVMDDFGDALYTVKAGVAAALTKRSQLKVELVDSYKTRPPDALTQKNDVALVTAIVYKF